MKKSIRVSDLSGNEIPEPELVQVHLLGYPSEDRTTVIDLSRAEIGQLFGEAGQIGGRRGRPRKTATP